MIGISALFLEDRPELTLWRESVLTKDGLPLTKLPLCGCSIRESFLAFLVGLGELLKLLS